MIKVVENGKKEIFNICEETRLEIERLTKELRKIKDKKQLRKKRYETEERLIHLQQTIERAEGLASKISVILPYLHDDFKQVNEMLENAKEKQRFSLKIIQAQEEERKKLAREIHDGPAQMIANILLRSELIEKAFHQRSIDDALKEIKEVRKLIRSSLHEVRRIIYDLRPMALDDLGLVPTIKKYINTLADYNKVNIEFVHLGNTNRLSQEYEVAFFRLIQESVQNAIAHASSTEIKVKLEIKDQFVAVAIQDNGKGFDLEAKCPKSFGLIGMRERVETLDGKIEIESVKGKGTQIYIKVPYQEGSET